MSILGLKHLQYQFRQLSHRYLVIPILIGHPQQISHDLLRLRSLPFLLRSQLPNELQHLIGLEESIAVFIIVAEDGPCGSLGHLALR